MRDSSCGVAVVQDFAHGTIHAGHSYLLFPVSAIILPLCTTATLLPLSENRVVPGYVACIQSQDKLKLPSKTLTRMSA